MKPTRFVYRASGVSERMAGFIAHLQGNGYSVGVSETINLVSALRYVDLSSHEAVQLASKSVCSKSANQYERFDELFEAYWLNGGHEKRALKTLDSSQATHPSVRSAYGNGKQTAASADQAGPLDEVDTEQGGDASHTGEGSLIASRSRNLEKVDLRELMTPETLQQAERIAKQLAEAIRDRRSRRHRVANRGQRLHMRKVMRASISSGGDPLHLYRTNRAQRASKIVALLDVSGSMMVYSKVFLAFLKGLVSRDQKTDAYLFHTSLVKVSDVMRDTDTLRAINRLSLMAQGFGGGTRIARSLQRFNQQHAAQSVNGRSVVIIFSDGYDTDPPEHMAKALARLKRRGCRIFWLNPLKGWKDYAPIAGGMSAAMPYLDLFASANTLESLRALEPHLNKL